MVRDGRRALWREEERQAAWLARELWQSAGAGIPVNVCHVATAQGLRFEYRAAPMSCRGVLFDCGTVIINKDIPVVQQRYVAAHELAHWMIDTRKLVVRPHRHERICQLFSANLLMPPDLVDNAAKTQYGRADMVALLAMTFSVSQSAMRIQLCRLGILPGEVAGTVERDIVNETWCDPILSADLNGERIPPVRKGYVQVPLHTIDMDAIYRKIHRY